MGNLRRLVVATTATAATLLVVAVSGAAPPTTASVTTFDQCANGKPPSAATDCPEKWINGILNDQNSHYAEDDVTAQRVILELPKDGPTTGRTIEISYLTRKGGVHAYDSLATWNHTQTTALRCADIPAADCVAGPATAFPIPADSTTVADLLGGGSQTSQHQLGGQVFTMYGGAITGVSSYTHDDAGGTSDSYAHVTITYAVGPPGTTLADDHKVMLLFGAHIAPSLGPRGWGVGVGAGSISGGPYHVRITAADGESVGNRDNQIQSGAILAPASLVINKVALGGNATFDYASTGGIANPFSITTSGGSGSQSFANISPGAYTVTESALPAGWEFTRLTCTDEDGGTTFAGQTANIDLDPGETATCTYTNTKKGNVVVKKETLPDGDPQSFAFSANYDADGFSLTDGGSNDSGPLSAGTYNVSETVPTGWDQSSATCDDGSSPASISLAAGETVTCTFTNAKRGRIIVDKVTVPAGDQQSFAFTLTGGPDAVNQGFSLTHAAAPHDSGLVRPGTYAASETVPAGWSQTSAACSDGSSPGSIDLGPGETVTCTFTNTKQGQVVVRKVMVGGTDTFDFTGTPAGSISQSGGTLSENVAPGQYVSTEGAKAGWALSSVTCDDANSTGSVANRQATFNVTAGEVVTCTFTNTKQGRIVVEKQTDPDGSLESFGFGASYDADGFSLADGQSNDSGGLAPGTYSVSENVPAGWALTSAVCSDGSAPGSIALAAGEVVTCVFTNTQAGHVVVQKQTNPDGSQQSFSFNANYDADGFSLADGQSNDSGSLAPGTYSVAENVPQGWTLASAVCSDGSAASAIALGAGETVTCVFTNTQAGKIVVTKQTLPDGSPGSFAFSASYDADGFSLADGQSNDSGSLAPGTYSVSENVPAGWELTSAVCSDESAPGSISLTAGETVTCVFTNTKLGSIVVEKQTSPDGAAGSFSYSGDAAGAIGDNGQIVVPNLEPGTYTSTEAAAEGWSLTSIACDDGNSTGSFATRTATFRVEAGEIVKCVFTNAKLNLGRGVIDVQKSATPTSMKEPGGPVTFSVTMTNVSPDVDVAIENVVDDKFGDLDDSGGNGCFDVPVNLAPGEKVNCTFERSITGPAGTVHVNTVQASGHDEFGNAVTDSDDARVELTPRLIDLVIVKEASSPTPLNGVVNYTLTVTNKGPDAATNVQVADPAPAGIVYLTAGPSQGTCALTPSLITCSLGTIAAGQTVSIEITARATTVGAHTNTATVTGSGGRETNPADNVDSAVTVVPAPLTPPTARPQPKPGPEICMILTVTPRMAKADGRVDRVVVTVTAGKKRVKGVKVVVKGAGVQKTARTNGKGVAVLEVNPKKPGLITITAVETNQRVCGPKRIGVVGVFLPPLTG